MKIVCTNQHGESLTVQYSFPFYYVSCEGLMSYTNDIATAEPYIAGEVYQGSHNPRRTMLLEFAVRRQDYWNLRSVIYSVFGSSGTFTWHPDEGEVRSILYYTESIEIADPNTMGFRHCSVSLVCPFPFFSGMEQTVPMSYWQKGITLPFVMHSPFVIGTRVQEQIKNIHNPQPVSVGIKAIFAANGGAVTNPGLQNLSTGESFQLEVSLSPGDAVYVSTSDGHKAAGFLSDDPQPFDLWDYASNDWIQLHPGDNLLRFDADSGLEYLDVSILYAQLYLGG
jgi:hypothetical protein